VTGAATVSSTRREVATCRKWLRVICMVKNEESRLRGDC
jgi:hypothetical protein